MKQGWEIKTLGDILEVVRNGVNCKQDRKGVGDKISRIESISNAKFDIDKVGYALLSKSDKEKYRLNRGDILFSHINSPIHVGKTALFNSAEEVYHGVNLLLFRPKSIVNVSYLEHYLKYLFQNGYWIKLCKQSVNQASVNQQDIKKIEIHYPKSLSEQLRIVFLLDQAFSALDKAKANAAQNLKNARELFESYLEGVFGKKGEGWEEKRFEELCKLTRGHNPPKSKFIIEPKTGYIRFYQIRDGWVDDYAVYVPDTPQLHKVAPDEILMVAYRHIGKVFRGVSGAFNVALCKISIKDRNILNEDFLFHMIPTDIVKGQLMKRSERSLIPSMSVEHLKEILIPLPTLKEQQTIVQKLDILSTETKRLEAIYRQKLLNLEELKKSVLQKAFNGEL